MNHQKGSRFVAHVSVVIPAYNGTSRYLGQAIRSVLAQRYTDYEIFVVDDASTDNTEALVHSFPQVRYVRHSRNAGQAAARNTGARLAQGPYVAFLDQDDLWEPTFLEETLAILEPATEAALASRTTQRLREILAAAPVPLADGKRIPLTFSAGVAEWFPGMTLDALFSAADGAMYRAKEAGRDRVEISTLTGALATAASRR